LIRAPPSVTIGRIDRCAWPQLLRHSSVERRLRGEKGDEAAGLVQQIAGSAGAGTRAGAISG
jgi:hypothetical protein